MFNNMSLQVRMFSSYVFMGLLVLIVALVGWIATSQLHQDIETLTKNHIPRLSALWLINEGQTHVQSAERLLFDPSITKEERKGALAQIKAGLEQIDRGIKQYEGTQLGKEEKEKYDKLKQDLSAWNQAGETFLELEREYSQLGIRNPWQRRADLISQGKKENAPEMAGVRAALELREQMDTEGAEKEEPLFNVADEGAAALLKLNDTYVEDTQEEVERSVAQSRFWMITGLLIGPITAAIFGIYFTNTIAKPLETQVQHSGIQITASTTQIAASGKELEAMVAEQVASTNEVVATAKEIAATSAQLVRTMDEVAEMASATATAAGAGQKDLARMESTMRQLADATSAISGKLGVISEKANNINSVVTTITKVADQTNLLSLNAAIEAEKAGEYGLGFAVVAREIRRLADQTAVASLDIEQMVKEMQSAVSTGVMEMDKFTKEVGRGVEDIRSISGQIAQIIERVQGLTPRFEDVSEGMEAQSTGALQISEAMVQLSEASSQTAQSLREINSAIGQLNEAAQGLRREILALR
ncbi:MAG: methyl-accepting chemotaxis protein [Oscillatoria princeps RMCB-10]|jgi:methyl-accepting chemotaxis protein WspA|nr:methyl-accepting chemotaxis protein [Oscillatoria princeps RMCB-10]